MPTVLPEANAVPQREESQFRLTGLHVLAMLVAFFGIVAGVNVVMIRYALTTHSGEVTAHPYEQGIAYNAAIREAREQEARGWKVDGQVTRTPDGKAQVEVAAHDSVGAALTGLAMRALLAAPADVKRDRRVELVETAPGVYRGEAVAPAGVWEFELAASRDDKVVFQSRNRITLN
ncbi:MAG TPA: FixH family protein [Rhodoblastus sp.]|nr:FixH family protein [Rhodoblastus sp.]